MDTTDNINEVFDVVDESDQVVGQATRGEVHSNKKLIHRSIGVAIINSNNKVFLQRRSVTKDTDALLWTISCSGHLRKGDNYEETAKRELKEELGIEDAVLNFLTKYILSGERETEMVSLYKANYDGEIILQKDEILEGRFFSREDVIALDATMDIELSLFGKAALEKLGFFNPGKGRFTK